MTLPQATRMIKLKCKLSKVFQTEKSHCLNLLQPYGTEENTTHKISLLYFFVINIIRLLQI